jgi:hypothetical protein
MRNRAFHPALKLLSLLLIATLPAQAGPLRFGDVVQVLSEAGIGGHSDDLRLIGVSPSSRDARVSATDHDHPSTPATGLTGSVEVASIQNPNVQTIEQGEISGTICDCGEIRMPGGGFPFFALLPLAAIPFFFIHKKKCTECDESTPTPTPSITPTPGITPTPTPTPTPSITPTPTPSITPTPICVNCTPTPPSVPEPSTILLFGSGLAALGAGARRRYMRAKVSKRMGSETEE